MSLARLGVKIMRSGRMVVPCRGLTLGQLRTFNETFYCLVDANHLTCLRRGYLAR
jgi:hypothetical protein